MGVTKSPREQHHALWNSKVLTGNSDVTDVNPYRLGKWVTTCTSAPLVKQFAYFFRDLSAKKIQTSIKLRYSCPYYGYLAVYQCNGCDIRFTFLGDKHWISNFRKKKCDLNSCCFGFTLPKKCSRYRCERLGSRCNLIVLYDAWESVIWT